MTSLQRVPIKNYIILYIRIRDIEMISCLEKLSPVYILIVVVFNISVHKYENIDKNKIPLWGNNNIILFNKDKEINMYFL